jgi:hypothetical protein
LPKETPVQLGTIDFRKEYASKVGTIPVRNIRKEGGKEGPGGRNGRNGRTEGRTGRKEWKEKRYETQKREGRDK